MSPEQIDKLLALFERYVIALEGGALQAPTRTLFTGPPPAPPWSPPELGAPGVAGHTCARCGYWVPAGVVHTCAHGGISGASSGGASSWGP